MKKKRSTYFAVILVLGLLFPMVQQLTGLVYVRPLSGNIPADSTQVSQSWWNGGLQKQLESYARDSSKLHPACVRLRNQIEFSLFDKLNAQDIYEFNGIFYRYANPAYNEKSAFVGMEKIRRQTRQLAVLEKQWHSEGRQLYVIITPSKLHYYRDQLPEWNKSNTRNTNYIQYKKALLNAGINVLDADAWFLDRKRKGGIPTMAKGGVHWTLYGGAIALDSLIRRHNRSQETDFQRVTMEIDSGDKIYPEDVDAINLCNLLYPPQENGLKLIHFPAPANPKQRIRPVVISDSYFNVIAWTPLHVQVLDPETPFYYYYHTRYTVADPGGKKFTKQQVETDISKANCVIIITDIQNLEQFGFGFIEQFN
ncbi:MAG TPA: hypothetical protein VK151_15090 [Fluviicola sp.]|nr:hypothetical protein [Fluviicola sp.]